MLRMGSVDQKMPGAVWCALNHTAPAAVALFTHTQGMQPRRVSYAIIAARVMRLPAPPYAANHNDGNCGSRSPCGTAWCWSPSAWAQPGVSNHVFHLRPRSAG